MATATAAKKTAKKTAAKPAATNGHVLKDSELHALRNNLLADPEARGQFADEMNVRVIVEGLIARRNELGLTATEIAKKIGASQPAMSQFEHGKVHPTVWMCQAYARAVGMRLAVHLEH